MPVMSSRPCLAFSYSGHVLSANTVIRSSPSAEKRASHRRPNVFALSTRGLVGRDASSVRVFNSHDNSIWSSRERHRFIAVQYNICKQRLTKIKHDYNKTTLQRIIFIDSEQIIITIIIISLLSKVSYLLPLTESSLIPPHRLLSCFNGMQIFFEILTVNYNNVYRAVVNIIRINHIIYFI